MKMVFNFILRGIMKRLLSLLLSVILIIALVGCDTQKSSDDANISIVVTAFPHYDFARQITKGVDNINIKMLIAPGNEVHTYEPGPANILAVSTCDIFIYTGGESDTWAKNILDSAQNKDMSVISFMDLCSDSIEEHEHEHEYDEHVWTNPATAEYLARCVQNVLCGKDERNSEKYIKNGDEFAERILEIENALAQVKDTAVRDEIIVADRFPFYHLANAYDFEYSSAFPGCSHTTEPSAADVANLSEKVKNENIPYVFTIEFSNKKIAKSVVEGTKAEILTLHSCHNVSKEDFDNGVTYCDLMLKNAENLRKALCE